MFFKVSGLEQGWQTFWRARTQIFGEILSHAGNLSLLAPHFRLFPVTLSTPGSGTAGPQLRLDLTLVPIWHIHWTNHKYINFQFLFFCISTPNTIMLCLLWTFEFVGPFKECNTTFLHRSVFQYLRLFRVHTTNIWLQCNFISLATWTGWEWVW